MDGLLEFPAHCGDQFLMSAVRTDGVEQNTTSCDGAVTSAG